MLRLSCRLAHFFGKEILPIVRCVIDLLLALRLRSHEYTTDHENIFGHLGHRSHRLCDPADYRVSFGREIS
jgi:hypothetical protein